MRREEIADSPRELQGLSHRPEKESLVQRNILPDSNAAPGIQGQQKELEKNMRADSLEKHLQARPEKEALLKEGILKGKLSAPFVMLLFTMSKR